MDNGLAYVERLPTGGGTERKWAVEAKTLGNALLELSQKR